MQGDIREHIQALRQLDCDTQIVKKLKDLKEVDGLIIPGGESTTIGKLATEFGLMTPLRQFGREHAIWGTCAGAIFLSKDAMGNLPLLNLMDIQVKRNAFGRQVDSFEIDLQIPFLKDRKEIPFHAVFIRAPIIKSVYGDAKVLLKLPEGHIVAARQGKLLATSFHPELTDDPRIHQYFVEIATS